MQLSAPVFKLKRQAKLLSRDKKIALHKALDQLAHMEGFQSWSHLASESEKSRPAKTILSKLDPGDMLLLGARPGHGKTLLGLELVAMANDFGRTGLFFTLEYTEQQVLDRISALGIDRNTMGDAIILDTSDEICTDYVISRASKTDGDVIIVIDYLQSLDQKRANSSLADQIPALRAYAKAERSIVVVISQIDRSFDLNRNAFPNRSDIRMPNPFDLNLFDKTCFLHDGKIRLETVA
ncbi:MAG: DNA helicase [Roseibium sp.]